MIIAQFKDAFKSSCLMARTVSEDELQQGFIDVINKMIEDSEHYINLLKGNMKIAIISRSPLQAETAPFPVK